jgi:DNA-binding transcriptional MerR regulator
MLTVNELAIQADTAAHVVRYYTRIGLIEPSAQQENGYRLFSSRDANRLRFIRMAKQLGVGYHVRTAFTQGENMSQVQNLMFVMKTENY